MEADTIRLAFVGDVCLSALGASQAGKYEFPGWPAIKDRIGKRDYLVGNLECCLVDGRCSESALQRPMAVPAEAASLLKDVGFTDLSLANNHMLDCGPEAIEVTREQLDLQSIRAFGAGFDLRMAEQAAISEHDGHKVALLGACDSSEYFATTSGKAGIAPLQRSRLGQRVRAAAANSDLVVVVLHSDLEFAEVPGPWRKRLSRWLIRQGADLVVQHHPHVLQGIETYHGGLIAYSLGNFIFKLRGNSYQEQKAGVFDSMVLLVDVDLSGAKPKLAHDIIPVSIGDDHLPSCLTGAPRQRAIQRIEALSSLLTDREKSRRIWFRCCRAEAIKRFLDFSYAIRRGEFRRGLRGFFRPFIRHEDFRWIRGLVSFGYL